MDQSPSGEDLRDSFCGVETSYNGSRIVYLAAIGVKPFIPQR